MYIKTWKRLQTDPATRFGYALFAFLLLLVAPSSALSGETVTWGSTDQLQADPFGSLSLFPGNSLSGNTLIIPSGTPDLPIAYGGAADAKAVSDNTVNIQGGSVYSVSGGRSNSGEVFNNAVHMSGGTAVDLVGGQSDSGNVRDNSVEITEGHISDIWSIQGGSVAWGAGSATGNSVTISDNVSIGADGDDYGYIAGGKVHGTGDASSNTVTLQGGLLSGYIDIYGGDSDSGNATDNRVTITGVNSADAFIWGGRSLEKTASSNTVFVTGSEVGMVFGGESLFGAANDNAVSVTNTYVDSIFGGYSEDGTASSNSVSVTGSEVWGVFGGESWFGAANDNAVSVMESEVSEIYGGYSGSGEANANSVSVTNSYADSIFGGYSEDGTASSNSVSVTGSDAFEIYGGVSWNGDANSNTVSVLETIVDFIVGGDGETANSNTVSVTGGDAMAIYGGVSWSGDANANSVSVTGANAGWLYGGYSEYGNVSGNTVRVINSQIGDQIFGGLSYADSGEALASGNLVYLENTTVFGDVYGGAVWGGFNNQAINNTVMLFGNNTLDNARLFGGSVTGDDGDQFTGNTLIVNTSDTARVDAVSDFENFAFNLPATVSDNYVALQANTIAFGNNADKNSKVTNITFLGGASALRTGDTISLFQLTEGDLDTTNLEGVNGTRLIPGSKGVTQLYDFALNEDGTAQVRGVRANPRAKALSEGFLSGLALTNQGADLIAGQGLGAAMRAQSAARQSGRWGVAPFAVLSGGSSRYDTGSHIDLDSFSLMAGLSLGKTLAPGDLTLGLFFEYGYGDYDTHNGFRGGNNVKGSGDTTYVGGGMFGRMDFAPTGPGRFHAELSARAGETDTDFSSSDLRDSRGRKADYDTSSTYYGLHAGLGYDWSITDQASLDLYGKYFWTHVEGDSVTLSTDDPVRFKDTDSHRLRAGARFSYAINERCTPYIGAAWEHEFDAKAKASSYGTSLDSPDLKGSTGIGELGLSFTPSASLPLNLDLAVQGYTGVREGVSGSIQFRLDF